MSKSKKAIWDCLDKFAGDTLPRRYSDTKDPSEMTADEYDDFIAQVEFQADCEKDDKMTRTLEECEDEGRGMASIDEITWNEREWTK
jgi:uncharacterized protein YcnI